MHELSRGIRVCPSRHLDGNCKRRMGLHLRPSARHGTSAAAVVPTMAVARSTLRGSAIRPAAAMERGAAARSLWRPTPHYLPNQRSIVFDAPVVRRWQAGSHSSLAAQAGVGGVIPDVAAVALSSVPDWLLRLGLFFTPALAILAYATFKGKGNTKDGLSRLLTEVSQGYFQPDMGGENIPATTGELSDLAGDQPLFKALFKWYATSTCLVSWALMSVEQTLVI